MHTHTARRRDAAARGAMEVRRRDDEPPGHDPGAHDLARAVDVVEEPLERAHPLRDAALDQRPLRRGDDARDEVERERPLLARVRERDALVAEDPVAGRAPLVEVLLRQGLHVFVERAVVEPGVAVRVEHLVPGVDRFVRVEEIAHRAHPDAAPDRRRVPPMKQRYRLAARYLTTPVASARAGDDATTTNPAERRRWNDERWTRSGPKRERFTDAVTPYLLDAARARAGRARARHRLRRRQDHDRGRPARRAARARWSAPTSRRRWSSSPAGAAARRARRTSTFQVVDMQHDRRRRRARSTSRSVSSASCSSTSR